MGFPSSDYIVKGPLSFKTIKNIYTGGQEKVLIDPTTHDGIVTKQQQNALQKNTTLGPGVRLTLEGNIGSGKRWYYNYFVLTVICREDDFWMVDYTSAEGSWPADLVSGGTAR